MSDKLSIWFGLSYAAWLTLPRVLMEDMPEEWQDKMADLLNEYDETYPNMPDQGTTVRVTENGKIVKTPMAIRMYRRPDKEWINKLKP